MKFTPKNVQMEVDFNKAIKKIQKRERVSAHFTATQLAHTKKWVDDKKKMDRSYSREELIRELVDDGIERRKSK